MQITCSGILCLSVAEMQVHSRRHHLILDNDSALCSYPSSSY